MTIKDLKKLEPNEQLEVGPTYHNAGYVGGEEP